MENHTLKAFIILLWMSKLSSGHAEELVQVKRNLSAVYENFDEENDFNKTVIAQRFFMFEYSLGDRAPDDEIIILDKKTFHFPKQDVLLEIKYPETKTILSQRNYLITSFSITVQQDSPESRGKLSSGGPGYATLGFSIEAAYVTRLVYYFKIYARLKKKDPISYTTTDPNY